MLTGIFADVVGVMVSVLRRLSLYFHGVFRVLANILEISYILKFIFWIYMKH